MNETDALAMPASQQPLDRRQAEMGGLILCRQASAGRPERTMREAFASVQPDLSEIKGDTARIEYRLSAETKLSHRIESP